jgi:hypothetical protein
MSARFRVVFAALTLVGYAVLSGVTKGWGP